MSMDSPVDPTPTPVMRGTRIWLVFNILLVFVAGIQLFVLSERTADFFAWTIGVPISAAYIGAGYWASLTYLVLTLRVREWQRVRPLWIMILTLAVFTFFVTFRDLSLFHLGSGPAFAQVAAWAWLAVYIGIPLISLAVLLFQERAGGSHEYEVRFPLLGWVRVFLLFLAVGYALIGLGLTFAPATFDDVWPWPVPRLPAGAMAAWQLTAAASAAWMLREGDWVRARFSAFTYIVFHILLIIAAIRFGSFLPLGNWQTWVYLIILVVVPALLAVAALAQEKAMRQESTLKTGGLVEDPGVV
jgi:hypothetical protein